jgi:hypothetical protein
MLKIYSIMDDKAQVFNTPYFAVNDLVSIRSFTDLCNDSRSTVSQHLGDFHLYCLGEFDDVKGLLRPYDMPTFVCHAMQCANVERSESNGDTL